MRLLCILVVTLITATASADPGKPPFEIVSVLPSTKQVLVYDQAHNTHVLLAEGSTFEDYLVVEIGGIGVTMEREQQRFVVYPRAAQQLALELEPSKTVLPKVFSKLESAPVKIAPIPVRVAQTAAATDAKKRMAAELASMLCAAP
jgi:hypothetical protein